MFSLSNTTNNWTLFLDRDGVINFEKENDYVLSWQEFSFYDSTLKALAILKPYFSSIVLVTNQKGVGKRLMTEQALIDIHTNMLTAIQQAGGTIHQIFYCTDLDDNSIYRKPNPGMAFEAKKANPNIDLARSIMVGNRTSDMHFGRNAGMHTVFLATTHPEVSFPNPLIDIRFNHLLEFAEAVVVARKS
jgi:histidinol-phosphate phosphatase family protein